MRELVFDRAADSSIDSSITESIFLLFAGICIGTIPPADWDKPIDSSSNTSSLYAAESAKSLALL